MVSMNEARTRDSKTRPRAERSAGFRSLYRVEIDEDVAGLGAFAGGDVAAGFEEIGRAHV